MDVLFGETMMKTNPPQELFYKIRNLSFSCFRFNYTLKYKILRLLNNIKSV
jgi:hypothetical protein